MVSQQHSPLILLFSLLLLLLSNTNGERITINSKNASQTVYFVQPFSTGNISFGGVSPFTQEQYDSILGIYYCFSWLIPRQPWETTSNCHYSTPIVNTSDTYSVPTALGYGYFLPIVQYIGEPVDFEVFIDTNDCEDSKAGPDCSNQAIMSSLNRSVNVVNVTPDAPVQIFFPSVDENPTSYSNSYVLEFNTPSGYSTYSYGQSQVSPRGHVQTPSITKFDIWGPSFSRTTDSKAGQYWVVMVQESSNVTVSANIKYCDEPNLLMATGSNQACNAYQTTLQLSSMEPNVPYEYNGTSDMNTYFSIKNTSNLYIAFDNIAKQPKLYVDNTRDFITYAKGNYFVIDNFLVNWDTIIMDVAHIDDEPVYVWTFQDENNMCPKDCNGKCEPGNILCTCKDGTKSRKCEQTNPLEGGWPIWTYLLVVVGCVVVVGVFFGVGRWVWKKKNGEENYTTI